MLTFHLQVNNPPHLNQQINNKYRGPVATINYKVKGGILGQKPSIVRKANDDPYLMDQAKMIKGISLKDYRSYTNRGIKVGTINEDAWFYTSTINSSTTPILYVNSNVDCEYQGNTRQDYYIPCYQIDMSI